MNITIPFSKEILFKSKIAEITSISLEHDVSINDKELLGDFIVSGEYKNLDINVDTNPFSHVVPFSVNLEENIDINTLKYEIEDFSYGIKDEDILVVNILFHVTADSIVFKHEELFEKPNTDEIKEEIEKRSEDFIIEENIEDDEDKIKSEERKINVDVLQSNELFEDYITYHIHLVKTGETIKTISKLYNISEDELLDLNNQMEISVGDKLLIPEVNEEE